MDERVVVRLRAHSSRLLGPALGLLLVAPVAGALLGRSDGWAARVVLGVSALVVVRAVVWPFLRWWTTTYELTTRRVSLRWGVASRHGRDVPWRHVVDVALDRSVRQRLLGCGTVVLVARGTASDGGTGEVALVDVPQPERLWRAAAALAEEGGGVWWDDEPGDRDGGDGTGGGDGTDDGNGGEGAAREGAVPAGRRWGRR